MAENLLTAADPPSTAPPGPSRRGLASPRLPGWQCLDSTAIGGPPGGRLHVGAVLLHPAHGIALIDVAPSATPRAAEVLRATLAVLGLRSWPAEDVPVTYLCLTPDELPSLPELLGAAVARRPPRPGRRDGAWMAEARRALDSLEPKARPPATVRRRGSDGFLLGILAATGLSAALLLGLLAMRPPGDGAPTLAARHGPAVGMVPGTGTVGSATKTLPAMLAREDPPSPPAEASAAASAAGVAIQAESTKTPTLPMLDASRDDEPEPAFQESATPAPSQGEGVATFAPDTLGSSRTEPEAASQVITAAHAIHSPPDPAPEPALPPAPASATAPARPEPVAGRRREAPAATPSRVPASPQCGALLARLQLGESPSNADRAQLRSACAPAH